VDTIATIEAGRSACLYGPTGSGKTRISVELMRYALDRGWQACFYINRRLLIAQTAAVYEKAGFHFGIRAAGWDDYYDPHAPIQICSIDTEESRVYRRKTWQRHPAKLVIIDEAHLQKTKAMRQALWDHQSYDAMAVGLTATPVGLSTWYDELVVSGTMAEYRACKALVPAVFRSVSQPDMRKVKRTVTGEYVMDEKQRLIFTQHIVGDVLDRWKRYNPDARPTMLFASGVQESVWFTREFEKMGVNWAHIDATDAVVDGKRCKLTRKLWEEILQRYKDGDIKGMSSRFKLREGLDAPGTYMGIIASPVGSLASYIQMCGRILRYSPDTPDAVVINDHAGVYWNHGSPNHDRPWQQLWSLPEHAVSDYHRQQIRDGKETEPIRCPKCESERKRGAVCPQCGFQHEKSVRKVKLENGSMIEVEGELIKPRPVKMKHDTEEKWSKLYWAFKNKKLKKSFNQLAGFFQREYHYAPPRDLPFMPKNADDWYRHVHAVPLKDLVGKVS
jgi:superfamily II DNA or RNA helicase